MKNLRNSHAQDVWRLKTTYVSLFNQWTLDICFIFIGFFFIQRVLDDGSWYAQHVSSLDLFTNAFWLFIQWTIFFLFILLKFDLIIDLVWFPIVTISFTACQIPWICLLTCFDNNPVVHIFLALFSFLIFLYLFVLNFK